ncbi:MAG: DUF1007 family protein [Pseudomonadota bacterium]
MSYRLAGPLTGFALICATVTSAWSHPHEFIQMRIDVLFNKSGQAVAMRQNWLFDEFFTAFAVEGLDKDGDGKPDKQALDALLVEILGNIGKESYFTLVEQDGNLTKFKTATALKTEMENNQLRVQFLIPFKTPVGGPNKEFRYATFDPTFYVAMQHDDGDDVVKLKDAPKSCGHEIVPPDPDPEKMALAISLDKGETAGDGLGIHFAEWVNIKC